MLSRRMEREEQPRYSDQGGYSIERLVGKTFVRADAVEQDEQARFIDSDGVIYTLGRQQSRCDGYEHGDAHIAEVIGDMADLVGSPITLAEEVSSEERTSGEGEYPDPLLWTFYRIETRKGSVTLRFADHNNHCEYYSIWVDFDIDPPPEGSVEPYKETLFTGKNELFKEKQRLEALKWESRPRIGDVVTESPVGQGVVTSMNEWLPRVNEVCCAWCVTERGGVFDPNGHMPKDK